jgi:hypothetical protein
MGPAWVTPGLGAESSTGRLPPEPASGSTGAGTGRKLGRRIVHGHSKERSDETIQTRLLDRHGRGRALAMMPTVRPSFTPSRPARWATQIDHAHPDFAVAIKRVGWSAARRVGRSGTRPERSN